MKVYINRINVNAVGIYNESNNQLEVLKDSTYRIDEAASQNESNKKISADLQVKGILSEGIFTDNFIFDSPSSASGIILGRSSNGLTEWVDEAGITIKAHMGRRKMLDYIKKNINNEYLKEYIKMCDKTVDRVQTNFPLKTIKDLPIEKWDKRGSKESLTYLIEHDTDKMLSGFLGTNQNKIFYQDKSGEYLGYGIVYRKLEGKNLNEKYKYFTQSIYDSIDKFNEIDYLNNKDNYILVGANVIFTKLLSFYKPKSILLLVSPTYFFRIFERLELGKINNDSIEANIILKKFIYDNIDKNSNIYAVSYLLHQFYKEEIEILYKEDKMRNTDIIEPVKEEDLNHIFLPDTKISEILNILERKQNIILQGVPGVGKTYIIKSILKSRYSITDDNYQMVQFHQSYSYEEFVEGLRPINGNFEVKAGLFKEFSKKALNDPENQYFFIIDEINRGNLSKIFGELLMLIESDKRVDYKVKLPYSNEDFAIPKNLYIIGTMNTADRSLSLVDYALRRRFSFINLEPAYNTPKFNNYMLEKLKYSKEELDEINKTMLAVNTIIEKNLSSNFKVGHSYFIIEERSDNFNEFINEIYKYEILPLIQEYFFDDESIVSQIEKEMKIYG